MIKEELIRILEDERNEEKKFIETLDFNQDLESPEEFSGNWENLLKEIDSLKNQWGIYLFFVNNTFQFNIKEYNKAKENGFQMSRCPKKDDLKESEKAEKKCLYVGSSQKLHSRLEQHLTQKNKSVYALHLSEWFPKKENLKLIVIKMKNQDIEKMQETEKKEKTKKMQKYEDYFWNYYEPLLGKQGKK